MFKKIYIEITNVCNLRCKFCPETKRAKKFMNLTEFEEIISKVQNYTNLICLHVKGEPLLHNQLEEIFKILDRYNLKANITTNGTMIKKKLEVLKNAKAMRQINFSIHSITQNEVFNEKYLQDIFESVDKIENVMISYRLWNIQSIKDNNVNDDIIKSIENYYNIQNLKQELMEKEFFKVKENIFINQDVEFTWPDIHKKEIVERGRCLALKDQIAILVDGTVVPCCLDNNGDIPLGNILEESLEDILKNPKSIEIKKNFENSIITSKLCRTCGFLKKLEDKRKVVS